ncbi:hypothetical protein BDV96DRAFT_632488 [Lophiotrema nucula]|uniref:MORN repeat-containing protein n=1 Tax=Lophiotrema nucula TaxID=690887 RepID=A0A6A5Z6U4_9PLEO|nr:hypothetical protein BDV96DRAFT_632488 [Lophiotrema nucula]
MSLLSSNEMLAKEAYVGPETRLALASEDRIYNEAQNKKPTESVIEIGAELTEWNNGYVNRQLHSTVTTVSGSSKSISSPFSSFYSEFWCHIYGSESVDSKARQFPIEKTITQAKQQHAVIENLKELTLSPTPTLSNGFLPPYHIEQAREVTNFVPWPPSIPKRPPRGDVTPRLPKPAVIPRLNEHYTIRSKYGKPFERAYPPALQAFGIPEEQFFAFLDLLNKKKMGAGEWNYVASLGSVVKTAGMFDPTGITRLVGASITLGAYTALQFTARGPKALKHSAIEQANEKLFGPRGLRVRIVKSDELRTLLKMPPSAPLAAPLSSRSDWTGVTPAERQLMALRGYATSSAVAPRVSWGMSASGVEPWARADRLNESFVPCRESALKLVGKANQAEYVERAIKKDSEVAAAEKGEWLVIEELDAQPLLRGQLYHSGDMLGDRLTSTFERPSGYIGASQDGAPNGWGVFVNHRGFIYEGEFVNGKMEGVGTSISETPIGPFRSWGRFKDTKEHGWVAEVLDSFHFAMGRLRLGNSVNGQPVRSFVELYPDGRRAVGQNERFQRQGTFTEGTDTGDYVERHYVRNSSTAQGGARPVMRNHGTFTYPSGVRWNGGIVDGKPQGYGLVTWLDGAKYLGEWLQGKPHGWGAKVSPNGSRITGFWRHGTLSEGCAYARYADGTEWGGEQVKGELTGFGAIKFADGSTYFGDVEKGLPHGMGCYSKGEDKNYGNFFHGKLQGYGKSVGRRFYYQGKYKDGHFDGEGVLLLVPKNNVPGPAACAQYVGKFVNGKPEHRWKGWHTTMVIPKDLFKRFLDPYTDPERRRNVPASETAAYQV